MKRYYGRSVPFWVRKYARKDVFDTLPTQPPITRMGDIAAGCVVPLPTPQGSYIVALVLLADLQDDVLQVCPISRNNRTWARLWQYANLTDVQAGIDIYQQQRGL